MRIHTRRERKTSTKFAEGDRVRYTRAFLRPHQPCGELADLRGEVVGVKVGPGQVPERCRVLWSDGHEAGALASVLEKA